MKVKDVEKLWKDRCASLVAGKSGLERKVDMYDSMEQPDIKPWLKENLLVITTGYAIRNDKKALLTLIRDLHEVNAAALAIKTRFFEVFPKEALELADMLEFPLFFLNNDAGFTDIVYPIMVALVEEKNHMEVISRYQIGTENKKELDKKLFLEFQTGKVTQEEEAQYRVNSLEWPELPGRLVVLQPERGGKEEGRQDGISEEMEKAVQEILERYRLKVVTIPWKSQVVCLLEGNTDRGSLEKILHEIFMRTKTMNEGKAPKILSVVTGPFDTYLNLRESYREAKECLQIQRYVQKREGILWTEDLQYERILLHLAGQEEIRSYVQERLGVLERYDREHDSHLLETLICLIRHKGSRKDTAKDLYLHRNTMAYRMRKIEEILGCDLHDMEQMMQLWFACKVRDYMFSDESE